MRLRIALCAVFLSLPGTVGAQENAKIYKEISSEQIEKIMRDLSIEFKRTEGKEKGVAEYAFTRNKFKLSLMYFAGKDLMLSANFSAVPLDVINAWNQGAKFSRAVLYGNANGANSSLEANLDCLGGVTEENVKYFINSFDTEVKRYEEFLTRLNSANEVYTSLSSERLERLLNGMKVAYKKSEAQAKGTFLYDFKKGTYDIRLTSFEGRDLMIDVVFPDMALEKVNKYNSDRKFVRVVRYRNANDANYVSLEANLDCVGGVTDNIVRWFIQAFDEEVQSFAKYLEK